MAGVAVSCGLVALLAATVVSLPTTLLEDTKQAALEAEPIAPKGKHPSSTLQTWNEREGVIAVFLVGYLTTLSVSRQVICWLQYSLQL
jgi:hypothetical protein